MSIKIYEVHKKKLDKNHIPEWCVRVCANSKQDVGGSCPVVCERFLWSAALVVQEKAVLG